MYDDRSAHREWVIREIKEIRKKIKEWSKEWWRLKYSTPESSTAQAYELVLMVIDNLVDHYDPEFAIQNLLQQELVLRVEAQFKRA
jgi:hypothetical protein